MARYLATVVLACSLSSVAIAQDSGPGPDPAGTDTQKQYDATFYQRRASQDGTLLFFAAADASSPRTTGDFESNVNGEQFSGTWYAYDVGSYAIWLADASSDTNRFTAFGWATPDFVVGRATIGSGGQFWWFWRWFSRSAYFLYGTAASPPVIQVQ